MARFFIAVTDPTGVSEPTLVNVDQVQRIEQNPAGQDPGIRIYYSDATYTYTEVPNITVVDFLRSTRIITI